jgi:predicted RNA-binding protein with TRAM domain
MSELKEWQGFRSGQKVELLIETKGDDHDGIEHTVPPGATGFIDHIERYDNDQGVVVAVVIKTNSDNPESHIVNHFDEKDGPIENFLKAM